MVAQSYLGLEMAQAGKTGAQANKNMIEVVDRSGSMSWTLDALCDDVCAQVGKLKAGDVFTFGWFSSPGQFNWAIKGFRVAGPADIETVRALVRKNVSPLGTTCFSGILESLSQVIVDLQVFNLPTDLFFLTDGHPVVPDTRAEIQASLRALTVAAPLLAHAMFVGYGDYYNKPLLVQMAEAVGGQLVHASSVREMGTYIDAFGGLESIARVAVRVHSGARTAVGVQEVDQTVTLLVPDAEGYVEVAPGTLVFFETGNPKLAVKGGGDLVDMGWLALALADLQRGDVDQALAILQGQIGDVALAQMASSAWTNAELGKVEAALRDAIFNVGKRFTQGQQKNRAIDDNAFCLLDALDVLMADPQAEFFPFSPLFEYQRIGVKSEVVGEWPKFKPDYAAGCPLNALVWNDARLNLSVSTRIPGTVTLNGDAAKHGFAQVYPTFVFRTYTLIKDGHLNVMRLPVTTSLATYHALRGQGMVVDADQSILNPGEATYLLDLTTVPIINRAMSDGRASATYLAALEWETLGVEGKLKAFNALRKRYAPADERELQGLTPQQEEFLKANGIGKGGYSVPTKNGSWTDVYTTKEFTIQYKGYSSLPSLNEVEQRLKASKPLTPSAELVHAGLKEFQSHFTATKDYSLEWPSVMAWLDVRIAEERGVLRKLRRQAQEIKFAVLLARRRFSEFNDNADEHWLNLGPGKDARFLLREVEVQF